MSNGQNCLPASHAEPGSLKSDDISEARVYGENCGEAGIDDSADLGGHTLLSRPSAPGRRSLFRR
jgi:hypothetical protein